MPRSGDAPALTSGARNLAPLLRPPNGHYPRHVFRDPYVSAVVHLAGLADKGDQPPVDDPEGVAAQGAAVLAGGPTAPVSRQAEASPREIPVPSSPSAAARLRGYFTSAGFEVHAPFGTTLSIGAAQSRFESFFDTRLVVDEEQLGAPMTTESGGRELPLEGLPEEVQRVVERISLPLPPELPGGP